MSSPTQRSLKLLRDGSALAAVTERWNAHARVRQDLFGFIDVVAIVPGQPGLTAVQATSAPNQAARLAKISALPAARAWLGAGNRIEVHGWRKSRGRWAVTITAVTLPKEPDTSAVPQL